MEGVEGGEDGEGWLRGGKKKKRESNREKGEGEKERRKKKRIIFAEND